jgi:hypothetical protein
MLQIVEKRVCGDISYCYLIGFRLEGRGEMDVFGEVMKTLRMTDQGKSAQGVTILNNSL